MISPAYPIKARLAAQAELSLSDAKVFQQCLFNETGHTRIHTGPKSVNPRMIIYRLLGRPSSIGFLYETPHDLINASYDILIRGADFVSRKPTTRVAHSSVDCGALACKLWKS